MSKFDRRRPGRPRDQLDKHLNALRDVARTLCSRTRTSVRAAAEFVASHHKPGISAHRLQVLYGPRSRELEIWAMQYEPRAGGKNSSSTWVIYVETAERLADEDERVAVLAKFLLKPKIGRRAIPFSRWYLDELRELIDQVSLVDPDFRPDFDVLRNRIKYSEIINPD